MDINHRCHNCFWWICIARNGLPMSENSIKSYDKGDCRAQLPKIESDAINKWPRTFASDWCIFFQSKEAKYQSRMELAETIINDARPYIVKAISEAAPLVQWIDKFKNYYKGGDDKDGD